MVLSFIIHCKHSPAEVPVIGLFHGSQLWFLRRYVTNQIVAIEIDGLDIHVFYLNANQQLK